MTKEYRLTIQAAGHNEAQAIESAVRMLNKGANFDEVVCLYEPTEPLPPSSREAEQR